MPIWFLLALAALVPSLLILDCPLLEESTLRWTCHSKPGHATPNRSGSVAAAGEELSVCKAYVRCVL